MNWFRVATEGATTDGRKISRQWIEQMAANFDPAKYGARVWMEHVRGLFHDGPFAALGDVTAVKAEEDEDGVLGLYVQIDPTDRLKEMNAERQKVYSSIEVDPDFAGTGEAYLVGIGVTDSPASLGTDMLKFSAQQGPKASPLTGRKQRPENLFSAAAETDFDFTEPEQPPAGSGPTLAERVKAMFSRQDAKTAKGFAQFRDELEETLEEFVKQHKALADDLASLPSADAFAELQEAHAATKAKLDELYTKLDNTPDTAPRGTATGGVDGHLTDC